MLFQTLQKRRDFLNQALPSASLNNQPPLLAFPQAVHSGRIYRPEYEPDLLDLSRIWQYLAHGKWFRMISSVGTFSIGGQANYLDDNLQGQQVELSFNPEELTFVCHNQDGEEIACKPIQGISIDTLMGDFPVHLPACQLYLPFSWSTFRVLQLFETLVS